MRRPLSRRDHPDNMFVAGFIGSPSMNFFDVNVKGSGDAIEIEGDVMKRDCVVRYKHGGRVLAVASIYRDKESLEAGVAMEHRAAKA